MGCTHREFFRVLPAALSGYAYRIDGSCVFIDAPGSCVEIELYSQGSRRLGPSLQLPATEAEIRFFGHSEQDAWTFLRLFDRHYQRGGG